MNQIIADVGYYETRAAVMEDNRLIELHFERRKQTSLVNNIYLGKIVNRLPGLQTFFVDIGYDKNVFVYKDQLTIPFDTLEVGDSLLIQITKDAMDDKGPKATMNLSLPGKYLVMLPQTPHVGISNKITLRDERRRLQEWASSLNKSGHGVIVRTEAAGQDEHALIKDWQYLISLWGQVVEKQHHASKGIPLYREHALLPRLLRDAANRETTLFLVNDAAEAETLRHLCRQTMPDHPLLIREADANSNPFVDYHVVAEWERAMKPVIPLKSGGSLVIHHTEALTSIDVNTGRFKGNSGFQESARNMNLEAAAEIGRQLRLRDIGGIIIIDFIDMKKPADQQLVVQALNDSLKQDRQKSVVLGMTRLGLVEMTRKRTREKVETLFNTPCPCCQGSGAIRSIYWSMYEIESVLRRLEKQREITSVLLKIHPDRYQQFSAAEIDLKAMVERYHLTMYLMLQPILSLDSHQLIGASDEESILKAMQRETEITTV
ncbi:MAG: Rne/Rng family ribonuclease [Bacillota bacterium]|nr:Rne/Rng family ribonuclease [Bacillota bacterium]MDW7677608.1 Rne/Rng family ribonuclease [Bacillota bacterium]